MRVGVVGAGITGLALTHYLDQRGVDVVTVEREREPGGAINSDRADGRVIENGPQRARMVPTIEELVDELGLQAQLLVADNDLPLYVYADDALREVPRSLSGFVRTDLLSWPGKLRLLAEPLTGSIQPDERAGAAFHRKFGPEAYHNVIEPLFGGIYGSDPGQMPAEHSLSRLMALEQRHGSLLRAAVERLVTGDDVPPPISFVDGMQTLPDELYRANQSRIQLDTTVNAIRSAEHTREGNERPDRAGSGQYVLETETADIAVDVVVVTVPAPAAAQLLADLPGARAEPLAQLTYNPLVLVHLHAGADAWIGKDAPTDGGDLTAGGPRGFGYQVRRDEPLRTLGVSWNASMFDRDGVYTAFLGGMNDQDILECTDEEIGRIARREFEQVMGVDPSVLNVTRYPRAFPAHDTTWAALDDVDVPDDVVLATNYTDRLGVPGRIRQAKQLAEQFAERV